MLAGGGHSTGKGEAPAAPEYPYTDILDAYRGAAEAADRIQEGGSEADEQWQSYSKHSDHNHTKGFQRLLDRLFGDYFKTDADEEIASDMADRWVAFARYGDPNYDGSKTVWRPWRYVFDEFIVDDDNRTPKQLALEMNEGRRQTNPYAWPQGDAPKGKWADVLAAFEEFQKGHVPVKSARKR